MIRSLLLAACFCALALSCAEARPRHTLGLTESISGCSQPDMRPCDLQAVRKSAGRAKIGRWSTNRQAMQGPRPRAWCGWWLSRHLGLHDRRLWRALEWRHVGRAAHGPAIGAIVIWSRGKGKGHVGIITGKTERGWVVLSGNDGNAVRERVRSVAGAVAFRWP